MIQYAAARILGTSSDYIYIGEDLSLARSVLRIWIEDDTLPPYEYRIETWENGELTGSVPIEEEIDG